MHTGTKTFILLSHPLTLHLTLTLPQMMVLPSDGVRFLRCHGYTLRCAPEEASVTADVPGQDQRYASRVSRTSCRSWWKVWPESCTSRLLTHCQSVGHKSSSFNKTSGNEFMTLTWQFSLSQRSNVLLGQTLC